ncbi:TonB-dependent receptor [Flavobacterium sp. C4GT6]|uniref:TonB-dependent receptor n=1 Tax=Flavobacterium sp. C4GT6 TaxID=3103818 RepID=UPI002ED6AF81
MKHILASCFLMLSFNLYSQHISISISPDSTLDELFKQIENQTDYKFAFTEKIDTGNKYFKRSFKYDTIEVKQLLEQLNNELPFHFSLIGNNITVKQTGSSKKKQEHTLSGTVLDDNQQPLIGASIEVKGLGIYTSADENGNFSLSLPSGNYTVVIAFLGFKNRERQVSLSKNTHLNFSMEVDTQTLNEVVINQNNKAVDIKKPQMSMNSLSAEEIKQIPVAMGEPDPLKALLTLPGVTNAGEASSGFNVRGGAADQNLILLDGAPIYSDSHMFGFFSVFNADAVNSLDLYKGGIPSKYGGRVSSVLDVKQQTGSLDSLGVNGGIGLISSRLTVKGPIQKGKSSFMVAGRSSYAHLFLKLADNKNSAMFYDINTRLNFDLNENNSLQFSGYLGNDIFDIGDSFSSIYGNTMGNLNWKHTFSQDLATNLSVFYSDYKFNLTINSENFTWDSSIKSYGFKYDWQHYLSDTFTLNYGIATTYYDFNPGTLAPDNESSSFNYQQLDKKYALEPSAYLDIEQKISDKINLRYGLRYSMFYRFGAQEINIYENDRPVVYNPVFDIYEHGTVAGSTFYSKGKKISGFDNFEPRAALSFAFNDDASVKASYNRMAQYLHILTNSQSPLPMNIWTPSGPFIKPQILDQFAVGYFRNFKNKTYSLETEAFYKKIKNRIDYVDGADLLGNNNLEQEILNGKARSYGLEVLVRKNTGRLTGWVAYTISRAEQKTIGQNPGEPGIANGDWYLSPYDKLHNLNITGNYELNQKWSFSANFSLQSGKPVTYPDGYYQFNGINIPNYSERNANRLPAYHHLDIAATYTPKPYKKKGWQSYWVFSIYNLYNRQNAASMQFTTNDDTGLNEARRLSVFGFIPSVSYNFKF